MRKKYKSQNAVSFQKPVSGKAFIPRTGLGTQKWMKMIYADKVGIGSTPMAAGGTGFYQFRMNSIFDPDFSGTGHQPTTHDQMAVLFEDYTVTDCEFTVSFVNQGTDQYIVGCYITDRQETDIVASTIVEQGLTDWKHLSTTNGQAVATFKGKVDISKLMGVTRSQYLANPRYDTVFGENPGDVAFLTLFATEAGSGSPIGIPIFVELVYTVRLTGTRLVPQS